MIHGIVIICYCILTSVIFVTNVCKSMSFLNKLVYIQINIANLDT